MEITKGQFNQYENVRVSGVTNLNQEQCLYIMKNYSELAKKYKEWIWHGKSILDTGIPNEKRLLGQTILWEL